MIPSLQEEESTMVKIIGIIVKNGTVFSIELHDKPKWTSPGILHFRTGVPIGSLLDTIKTSDVSNRESNRKLVNGVLAVKKREKKALVVDVQGPREAWEFSRGNWDGPIHFERDQFQQKPLQTKPVYYRNDYSQRKKKNNKVNQPRQSHKSYKERNGLRRATNQ